MSTGLTDRFATRVLLSASWTMTFSINSFRSRGENSVNSVCFFTSSMKRSALTLSVLNVSISSIYVLPLANLTLLLYPVVAPRPSFLLVVSQLQINRFLGDFQYFNYFLSTFLVLSQKKYKYKWN